jgi:DNA transformation protein and related proteins
MDLAYNSHMASSQSTADFLADQMRGAGTIRTKKMFGEYGMYCNDKVVAFICDDRLYVKPTKEGETYIGKPELAPAYPSSKDYFLIEEDKWEDTAWLSNLIRITADAVPAKKKK